MPTNMYTARIHGKDYTTRIRLGAACCDSDSIPKVENAGGFTTLNGQNLQIMHNGVLVTRDGYYGKWMTDMIKLLRGHHEPQEEFAFYRILQNIAPQSVMIELGSYWAYYSLWFNKAITNARNIMIEPNGRNVAVGVRNFETNGCSGEFLQAYVGKSDLGPSAPGGIGTVSLDGLLKRYKLERVHLLHVDIQGAEVDLLIGGETALKNKRVDFVFVSTHGDDHRHYPCVNLLGSYGYEILCEHTMIDSFSFDGLIVAKSPEIPKIEPITISKRSMVARAMAGYTNGLKN